MFGLVEGEGREERGKEKRAMTYIFSIGNYLTYHSIKCVSNKMIYKKCACNTRHGGKVQQSQHNTKTVQNS